jgi:hypothetical protein
VLPPCFTCSCTTHSGHAYGELQSVSVAQRDSVLAAAGRKSVFPRVIELAVHTDTTTGATDADTSNRSIGKGKHNLIKVCITH